MRCDFEDLTHPDMVGPVNPVGGFLRSRDSDHWGPDPELLLSVTSSRKGPRATVALDFVTTVDPSDIRGLVTGMSLIRQGLPLLYKLASAASCDQP